MGRVKSWLPVNLCFERQREKSSISMGSFNFNYNLLERCSGCGILGNVLPGLDAGPEGRSSDRSSGVFLLIIWLQEWGSLAPGPHNVCLNSGSIFLEILPYLLLFILDYSFTLNILEFLRSPDILFVPTGTQFSS